MTYEYWIGFCLVLIIIGLIIDRGFLIKKHERSTKLDKEYYTKVANDYRKLWAASVIEKSNLRKENKDLNDLLDLYIECDFEQVKKKVIVKRKKKK